MRTLGLVTARGGSKGIPGKNLKPLLGKPLIVYTIEAARASGALDRLIVSTDDPEIAAVALESGCEVPFTRPPELAADDTPHVPVVQHAVEWLRENEQYEPEAVMVLQPTSPARQPFHIREALELLEAHPDADSVLSVSRTRARFNSAMVMRQEGGYLLLVDGAPVYHRPRRRQDLTPEYWSTGIVYLLRTRLVLDPVNPNLYGERTLPYEVDERYAVDLNESGDWPLAEAALQRA